MKILQFSSKQKASVAIAIFFALLSIFLSACIDGNYVVFPDDNVFAKIRELFKFPEIFADISGYILLIFIDLYLVFGLIAFFITLNKIHSDGKTLLSSKLLPYVLLIGVGSFVVFFGLGSLFSIPYGWVGYLRSITFTFEALFFGLLILLVCTAIFFAVYLTVLAIPRFSRKPIPGNDQQSDHGKSDVDKEEETIDDDVTKTFVNKSDNIAGGVAIASAGVAGNGVGAALAYDKERVFPNLTAIDEKYIVGEQSFPLLYKDLTLKKFTENLQNYLATTCSLYYSFDDLALFVSAILTTPLTILEGVSGTGKSSLPRFFARFIGETSYFEAIQMTYKDRDDILGYYNDFSASYHETEFLKRLYEATYRLNHLNIMVLDEMNISRVEYYFADFLSVMEYPESERIIHVANIPHDPPTHLADGDLLLTPNTRFVGTANTDDSTFAITDKVIDRAIVIDFDEFREPLAFKEKAPAMAISYKDLNDLAKSAKNYAENTLTQSDVDKLTGLLRYADSSIGVKTGNRFIHQAEELVPIFYSITGSKEKAFDYLFAFKVLRKAKGRVDLAYRTGLKRLLAYVDKEFGAAFSNTKKMIEEEVGRNG